MLRRISLAMEMVKRKARVLKPPVRVGKVMPIGVLSKSGGDDARMNYCFYFLRILVKL